MTMIRTVALGLLAATALTGSALAQDAADDKLKVGLMFTLSGPAAVLGEQGRDGFMLAVETMGGKLGGLETEITTVDDELKPDIAANKARELVERDDADFVVGPIFSNILMAIAKPVTDGGAFLISPNAGTSNFAGAECNANLFVSSYQNDQVHEVLGKYAEDTGYKRLFLLAPNYQAGKDSLAGFKRSYKGEVVNEIYTPLGQLDFSAELAQIAAEQPDAVFTFMPGGMGVNLVKQYRQAGLDNIPFLSAFTVDETTLPAQQDAAVGFFGGANWAPDMDNEQSKAFVAAYEEKYGSVPGTYAMQAYDAAQMIDSAIKAAGGDLSDKDALRAGLKAADFQSLRGDFSIGDNHYPIQDFYLVKVAKRDDGKYQTQIEQKIFDDYQDNYAADCKMQ
ncbi:MAG: ABC transporter substrate-binding protein [Aurantimonas coralicida]|nr:MULTISPECIES: ABC transporter substrate-binding protein [Aurantimonas]MBC6716743.1 ABC transporter substrate-binding protein [Aurantimonas sp. DM33-3]MCC4298715.1 ABC transporter substrate-binding protein [Aurantimonas coralicida]MCD1643506.1 ABC transporter substrate-binding protein [Aurantimonas coralicida]MDE0924159.1 ABC transporter substrate-binding protein [Aurantimonas coralicida]